MTVHTDRRPIVEPERLALSGTETAPAEGVRPLLDAVAELGLGAVELWYPRNSGLLGLDETLRLLDQEAVRVACVSTATELSGPGPAAAAAQTLVEAVDVAAGIGCGMVNTYFGWPPVLDDEAAARDYIRNLRPVLAAAERRGVVITIENEFDTFGNDPLGTDLSRRPDSLRRLLQAVGSPHFRLAFDPCNAWFAGVDPLAAYAELAPFVAYVHVKDGRRLEVGQPAEGDWPQCTDQGRRYQTCPLGEGDLDWPGLLGALERDGYRGDFALEPHAGRDRRAWAWRQAAAFLRGDAERRAMAAGRPLTSPSPVRTFREPRMSPSAHTPDPAADSHAASAVPEIEVAFFGKTHEPLSLFGLRTVAAEPGLRVRSLTCRRRPGTEPTGPLIDLAKELDIPVRTFEDLAADATPPDLVISFSNSIVFPGDFIERVPLGIVNMHPAPLPAFRGNDSIEHLLMNGETTFGATLHYCDSGIDTGPVIELCEFPVEAEDNATSVWAKVDRAAEAGLRRLLPLLVAAGRRGERVPAHPQSSAGSRFYPVRAVPETCELDPGASWEDTVRLVRAYDHPRRTPAYFRSGDSRVEVGWRGGQIAVLGVSALAEADR